MIARSAGAMIALVALLSAATPAFPAEGSEAPESGILSLVLENDLFYDNDQDYTNGIELVWVPTGEPIPGWSLRVARWLPWFPDQGQVHHGYAFGQNMFTPRDITLADPPLDDRPYGGWLYATLGLGVETGRQLDQVWMTLGVVGPASLAEEGQRFIHDLKAVDQPQGWETQLDNELGVVLGYQRGWRELAAATVLGLDLDLTPHLGGAIGNVYTYADAGLTVRYGQRLPLDYGPPRIQPSVPGTGFFASAKGFEWYLFVGLEGRALARNIFLDGNTFRDSRSVDREPLVGDLQWGAVVTWRRVRLSYTHVVRTSEFETQAAHDEFGAVSLSVSF